MGAGAEPLPAFLFVVDPQQAEEPVGGGGDVGAEKGDFVAERIEVGVVSGGHGRDWRDCGGERRDRSGRGWDERARCGLT